MIIIRLFVLTVFLCKGAGLQKRNIARLLKILFVANQ